MSQESFAVAKSGVSVYVITPTLASFTLSNETTRQTPLRRCALANSKITMYLGHNIIYILKSFWEPSS